MELASALRKLRRQGFRLKRSGMMAQIQMWEVLVPGRSLTCQWSSGIVIKRSYELPDRRKERAFT